MPNDDKFTMEYYAEQAKLHGDKWSSTMQDETVRTKEIEFIKHAIGDTIEDFGKEIRILDLGCGNGFTTEIISKTFPEAFIWGTDLCNDLLRIGNKRNTHNCKFLNGDARKLNFENNFFDLVYTERCLINIRDWQEQRAAIAEVSRVLRPGGRYAMIECFTDGHKNYNTARKELGLSGVPLPEVNLFFEKEPTMTELEKYFEPSKQGIPYNFLSTHYFVARVFHAAVSVSNKDVRNSEFVKFFSTALPTVGNYSPIQAFLLRKLKGDGRNASKKSLRSKNK